ncbi:hypothetical protein PO909_004397 [Leuciscus waleckii]
MASSAVRSRTSPNSSRPPRSRLRRLNIFCPDGPLPLPPSLLAAEGTLLRLPPLLLGPISSLHPGGAPKTGCSKMAISSFREMVAGPLLPLVEGRGRIFCSPPPAARPSAGSTLMWLKKELTHPSLSIQSSRMTVRAAHGPRHSRPPLLPDPWGEQAPVERWSFPGLICQDAANDHAPTPGHYASLVRAGHSASLPHRGPVSSRQVVEAALVPLRQHRVRILNYLEDWLILAHSRDQVCEHSDLVLWQLARLGLRVNWEKSKLFPRAEDLFSWYGNRLGHHVHAAYERARAVTADLPETVRGQECGSTEVISEAPGAYGLHMRPLQLWLHDRVPRCAWQQGILRVPVTPTCHQTFTPWTNLSFLRARVPLERVSRHVVVSTDASTTGWGAMCNGHAGQDSSAFGISIALSCWRV